LDSSLQKVRHGEPIFVLRGQDLLAPNLVEIWAKLAKQNGCPQFKVDEALNCAKEMREWSPRKFPD
jgi:hypothetical protein